MERLNQIQKRTALEQARDVMAIPLAAIAIFFYVMWQLVAEQQLFLHTFLVERMGKRGVEKLPLGYWNVLTLKSIMLCQHLSHNPNTLRTVRKRTERHVLQRLQDRGVSGKRALPITKYRPGEIDPKRFYREHVKRPVPCILRGFGDNAPTDWTLAKLAELPGYLGAGAGQAEQEDDQHLAA